MNLTKLSLDFNQLFTLKQNKNITHILGYL